MDDVDRLFECFKCGVSPPQSAVRERKKGKQTVKQHDTADNVSTSLDLFSSSSKGKKVQNAADVELCLQNTGSSTTKIESLKKGPQFSPLYFMVLHMEQEIWATFPRQDEAMKYAKEQTDARVFSYQDHVNGQRRFLVSTYKEFWRRYESMNPKFRHHYEVIQEGLPCHLYFDLEFNKRENADRNGDEMVDLLLKIIFDAVVEKYCLEGNNDWVVELDSSNEGMIFNGWFYLICSRISSISECDGRFRKLFVSKDSSSIDIPFQLFVDKAVYSRNRCFRLALSSKAGKTSVLLPSGRFKCKNMSEEEVFMASLICNMDADVEKLLICTMDLDCVKTLQFDTESSRSFQQHSGVRRNFDLNACTSDDRSRTYLMGKSPFPYLDVFVESVASIGNIPGKIRSWFWFSEYALMVYNMSRNRFCERIGRQHKSNHVIYVVDLQRDVYYQKCHDPECRGYRSSLRPVPDNVIPHSSISFNLPGYNLDEEKPTVTSDKSISSSCNKEWWLEAIRVADSIENVQKALDLTEEEDDWWMAVERTAYQTELSYFGET
ncbi:unnamed protein product [Withania somnifera]